MSKTVAIHQPNYIPWLGYFYKIAECDIFIYLDTVQYPRGRSFSPRNRIKSPNGTIFLTIPVSVPGNKSGKAIYTEIDFADNKWQNKHLKTIELNYKKSSFFEVIFEIYKTQILNSDNLVNLNINLIDAFSNYLEIKTKRIRLSEILINFGQKNDLIIQICKQFDADIYLSGNGGGREYNDELVLNKNGIKLKYSGFQHPVYKQLWSEFEYNLSIIDLLFNYGPNSHSILFGKKLK